MPLLLLLLPLPLLSAASCAETVTNWTMPKVMKKKEKSLSTFSFATSKKKLPKEFFDAWRMVASEALWLVVVVVVVAVAVVVAEMDSKEETR